MILLRFLMPCRNLTPGFMTLFEAYQLSAYV
jgi:hypothetical protein